MAVLGRATRKIFDLTKKAASPGYKLGNKALSLGGAATPLVTIGAAAGIASGFSSSLSEVEDAVQEDMFGDPDALGKVASASFIHEMNRQNNSSYASQSDRISSYSSNSRIEPPDGAIVMGLYNRRVGG